MHPDYVAFLASTPSPIHPDDTTYAERRQQWRDEALAARGPEVNMTEVRDVSIDLSDHQVGARLYVPPVEEHGALVLYFHGGSFVEGDLDIYDDLCRRLSVATAMRFLSVDYRLAPEFPFPAGLNDAIDVTRYVAAHRSSFDLPDAPLLLMGDSAGGAIAAVVSAELRQEDLGIVGQVLIYPTMGPDLVTNSSKQYGSGYLLEMDNFRLDYLRYLGDHTDHTDPRVTPLLATDLTGVAPAIVIVSECDPLRDEAVAYAGLLEHFAVPVELVEAEGMLHGFLFHGPYIDGAWDTVADVARHMASYVAGR